jgi:hypothetical protein
VGESINVSGMYRGMSRDSKDPVIMLVTIADGHHMSHFFFNLDSDGTQTPHMMGGWMIG